MRITILILISQLPLQYKMNLSIIAAIANNQVIGLNNRLPWNLPSDLKRFKSLTMGHHLLMGRKTFESIGRPLPGRTTVVITRQKNYTSPGIYIAHSLQEALQTATNDNEILSPEEQKFIVKLYALLIVSISLESTLNFTETHTSLNLRNLNGSL